jgi:hypothetical protein
MILRIKRLIMESVPYEAGKRTNYNSLYSNVDSYCNELGYTLNKDMFNYALRTLHDEQAIVVFSNDNIKPTQYGLNKYQ